MTCILSTYASEKEKVGNSGTIVSDTQSNRVTRGVVFEVIFREGKDSRTKIVKDYVVDFSDDIGKVTAVVDVGNGRKEVIRFNFPRAIQTSSLGLAKSAGLFYVLKKRLNMK